MLPSRRDSYIDYWRGLFHIMMLVDHLPFLLPGLTIIDGLFGFFGYVTVAEGFVFLSGYVTGLVYTRIRDEKGQCAVRCKAVLRAFTIYATYVVAVLFLVILVRLGGTAGVSWDSWSRLFEAPPATTFVQVVCLLWQPSFLEILPMYSLFLLVTPAILPQLDRGRYWLVISVSILVWTANQFGLRDGLLAAVEIDAHRFGSFNFCAWQILFVCGMICGHKTHRKGEPWLPKNAALAIGAGALALLCFAWSHDVFRLPFSQIWVRRSSIAPVRLANFICLAFLAARFRGPVGKLIKGRELALLSQHSLQVFAFHLIPIYGAAVLFTERGQLPWWAQLLFICPCVLGLFYIAWLSSLVKSTAARLRGRPTVVLPLQAEKMK